MEKYISYHNYKGGTNNLKSIRVGDRTFTSSKGHADKRADRYIKKMSKSKALSKMKK